MRGRIAALYLLFFSLIFQKASAQEDTACLKLLYDRALDFNSAKADSVLYYANHIESEARKLNFDKGTVLSLRLKGIYQEFREEYDSAISFYYQALEQARVLKTNEYESSALSDLAMAYNNINQPQKAKDFFKEAFHIATARKEVASIFINGSNLGSIYNRLGYPDSALFFLEQAENIAQEYNLKTDLHSVHNNIGNAWFHKKQWNKALRFFMLNYAANLANGDREMLWYDCLNIGDVYIEKRRFDSARKYIDLSFDLAKSQGSKRKEADVHFLDAKYYSTRGNYKAAYYSFQNWYNLDTALISRRMLTTVAELQEKYNLKQKEQKNGMLELEIDRQKLVKRNIVLLALGIAALAVSAFVSLLLIRRKNSLLKKQNELIQKQNNKLARLNAEKNSLISVVSHDLNGPFTSIKMWSQILLSDVSNFTADQKKALYRIQSSADNGELLIRDILYIEKEEIKHHTLNLEELEVNAFLDDIVHMYQPQAQQKEISISYTASEKLVLLISDRYIVSRICENLLSNAIKFTPRGKRIGVSLLDTADAVHIKVEDEGVGIAPEDIPYLFSKYRKISSMPTEGEYSTGLGLSIVKRLVEELNGKIVCKSEPGKGSLFTVILQK
ncbi:tetratricopeptide repeat-containing sensor histidine kinase [Agriterribacter sp.]|uniref:tetratricopeptide repeat-containing sensor histidine kinase n=1 Tax=Agriterribacter sp. TaxID=2821509 RepID=UPI002C202F04|nr:tetratricopeptide repeat-containing sensor histidine kinase [Agriterribacter sp.]HTN08257.1 tetratricopeptide repeat-containing sensor histidine kinase [Agriterribacter sp.]